MREWWILLCEFAFDLLSAVSEKLWKLVFESHDLSLSLGSTDEWLHKMVVSRLLLIGMIDRQWFKKDEDMIKHDQGEIMLNSNGKSQPEPTYKLNNLNKSCRPHQPHPSTSHNQWFRKFRVAQDSQQRWTLLGSVQAIVAGSSFQLIRTSYVESFTQLYPTEFERLEVQVLLDPFFFF